MDQLLSLAALVLGSSGLSAVVVALLNRRWIKADRREDKTDRQDDRIDALVDAQKVLMIDRVRHLGQAYITRGDITIAEKETLHEMHKAYKNLGGNGHLDTIMGEVDELPVR